MYTLVTIGLHAESSSRSWAIKRKVWSTIDAGGRTHHTSGPSSWAIRESLKEALDTAISNMYTAMIKDNEDQVYNPLSKKVFFLADRDSLFKRLEADNMIYIPITK